MKGAKVILIETIVIIVLIGTTGSSTYPEKCPERCTCKKIPDSDGMKVICNGNIGSKINSIKEIDFSEIYTDIVQLDLSKNQIQFIEASDFSNMTNLKKLDISSNSLKQIDEYCFPELKNFERLFLQANSIAHIFPGSFSKLKSLKVLDISSNPLACDCNLVWLVSWSTKMSVKLLSTPKCATPAPFANYTLKKLKIGTDFHCESPLSPILEMKPDQDQLVFEGDPLILQCRAPRVAVSAPRESEDLPGEARLFWGWSDKIIEPGSSENVIFYDPQVNFTSIHLETRHLTDSGLLDSILRIPSVTKQHTGMWDCRVSSHQINSSKNISVVVISNDTRYCMAKKTSDNKGDYHWPKSIRGKVVQLPCMEKGPTLLFAYHKCNESGDWINLDTSQCSFIRESTKILEQFFKVNLTIARGSVLESAKRLRNYTMIDDEILRVQKFRDPIDIVFIARTVDNYLEYVTQEKDLGSMLLDILSQIIVLPYDLFEKAQNIDKSCSKLVNAAERSVELTQTAAQTNNLALAFFKIRTDSFTGITCSWLKTNDHKIFQCNTEIKAASIGIHEKNIDALIQFPNTIFSSTKYHAFPNLLISVFQNSNFFPQITTSNKTFANFRITSSIIGAKMSNRTLSENLTEPIYVILRAAPYHHILSQPRPVWWDQEANSGYGGWTQAGCQLTQQINEMTVFMCNRLGYYGLIQNTKYINDFDDTNAGARFRLSPPAYYVGGVILFITMWINIVTYIVYGNAIQMARRTKHSFVNMCLAISFLSAVFTVGIYQTENYKVCQGFGMAIHYLSLCVLLWMCVNVSNMYKRMSKNDRHLIPNEGDLPKEHIGHRPILGLYLVGWGIAMIICGISGAVHIKEYATYSYCFLKTGPALSAIFVPALIFTSFLFILFICIRCHLRNHLINGHMSEGTQATENVDLDLLEPPILHNNILSPDRCQSISICTPTTSTNIDDQEHSLATQLKSHIIILFLYLMTWASAAISIATPFADKILYEEEVFGIIYAILATILGLFITFFYGFSRSDVRLQWGNLSCYDCRKNKRQCCRPKSVSDSKEMNGGPIVAYHTTNTLQSVSRSNSQSSKNRKNGPDLNSHTLNRTDSPNGAKVNLVLLHRQQFVHNPVLSSSHESSSQADIFYNPNQINVARKFFRKQKRLAKQNNIEIQRTSNRDYLDGSDVSSILSYPNASKGISIFSGGSKVNNTNIHVDRNKSGFGKDTKQMNPNILSDSCNESDLIIDPERFVLGSDSLRAYAAGRTKINNIDASSPLVANIYTNVSETGKPEHEIITVRQNSNADKRKSDDNPFFDTTLEDVDEEDEENNLNNPNDGKPVITFPVPHYVNENYRNIELSPTSEKNLNSSNVALMNTVGLPIVDTNNQSDSLQGSQILILDKDKEYISAPLEISENSVYYKIYKKSKSLEHFHINENKYFENQTRSISCNNIILSLPETDVSPLSNQNDNLILINSQSPILFSPSLCDIDDLSSSSSPLKDPQIYPFPQHHNHHHHHHHHHSNNHNFVSTPVGSEINLNLFNAINNRNNLMSSPTSESDINYQNSELSIRSHGLYAPQPMNDTDLNLTLTVDEKLNFPYQSSELSDDIIHDDGDEVDEDDEEMYNCSRDLLLRKQKDICDEDDDDENNVLNESQSSIDELYQQITRRKHNNRRDVEYFNEHDEENSQCSVVVSYVEPMLEKDN